MDRKDQRPAGGCVNCGGPVRTRKTSGWVCAACERALRRGEARVTESEMRLLDGNR